MWICRLANFTPGDLLSQGFSCAAYVRQQGRSERAGKRIAEAAACIFASSYATRGSILFVWAIKTAVLRWGGPRLYNTLKPLFLGFIIGEWSPKIILVAWEWARQNL